MRPSSYYFIYQVEYRAIYICSSHYHDVDCTTMAGVVFKAGLDVTVRLIFYSVHPPVCFHTCVQRAGRYRKAKQRLLYCDDFSQVDFVDCHGLLELNAVEVDPTSTYMAEDTSFIGFDGEVYKVFLLLLAKSAINSVSHVSSPRFHCKRRTNQQGRLH